jgi:hypothetical protein
MLHSCRTTSLDGREVAQGRVIYFAGENPDDVRMRWIAMAEHFDFDPSAIDVHFVPSVFDIPKLKAQIHDEVEKLGGVSLVIVDTSACPYRKPNAADHCARIG